jgi:hypothetical protein
MAFIMAAAMAAALSCKKESAPGSIDALIEGLAGAGGTDEARRLYTRDTLDAIGSGGRTAALLPAFPQGSRCEVLSRSVDGDRAEVTVRFAEHPVQNMVGFTMRLRLAREDGGWKIDLREEIEKSLPSVRKDGAADYIRKLRDPQ